MKFRIFFISTFLFCHSSLADSLLIHNGQLASESAYTSSDFIGSIPYWIWRGQLVDLKKANEVLHNSSEIICSLWMMDWSDEKNLTRDQLKSMLFESNKSLEIWKRVSGKTIFILPSAEAALSYVCVQKKESGEIIELDYIEDHVFNTVFHNIVELNLD